MPGVMAHSDGILRWSPNPTRNEFLTINLSQRLLQVYKATGHAWPGRFDFQKSSSYSEFPLPNTYDWSPIHAGLLAVGTSYNSVHLLRIDDSSNADLVLPLRIQRPCQSVAFNTTGLLAVGLDRVRSDSCLQIWDIEQRLSGWDPSKPGWDLPSIAIEPRKVEASLPVTSIKFFEDQPQSLVIGIKNQSVRILDLREPSPAVMTFQTKCNNNICIDYTDPNYFASSSLDSPGLMVWDRRASSRAEVSPMYQKSLEESEVSFGTALELNHIIETRRAGSYVRSLRFSRDQRNMLGILSNTGQLQVLKLNKEYVEPGSKNDMEESPALLQVKYSYDLEHPFYDEDHKQRAENRVVSFDWIPIGTSELRSRIVALRANGNFDVMCMPSYTAGQLQDLVPWRPPHRLGDPYMTLAKFADPEEHAKVLGPLYESDLKSRIPVFGRDRYTSTSTKRLLAATLEKLILSKADPVVDYLPFGLQNGNNATKRKRFGSEALSDGLKRLSLDRNGVNGSEQAGSQTKSRKVSSSRELHDLSHYSARTLPRLSKAERELQDHVMLRRAIDGYLFNGKVNRLIVADDKWLQSVWDWISNAETAASDDGMILSGVDLSYSGVYTIWNNLLGHNERSRLLGGAGPLDSPQWEYLISVINKRTQHDDFFGIETLWPHHRQLCLAVCGLAKPADELNEELKTLVEEGKITMGAALALFEGNPERAVEILKGGGTNLLFVAMALDIKLKSNEALDLDQSGWNKALEDHPQLEGDPWLRAIYGYITTGDWEAIAQESSLPLRDRVGVALRNFKDIQLGEWLSEQMEEVTREGDIEGIVLAGITDNMVDILAKYVEKFMDYQTPVLIMSYAYPRYVIDARCAAWRKTYRDFLQRHKKYILRVKYEQQSTIKSRLRDGTPLIKPPPRQVTIRCLNCDVQSANDLSNSAIGASTTTATTMDTRSNPLAITGINAGLCCPRCGSRLARCALCMEVVGVPRSDRPELSSDPAVRRMANFPTFCLKCKHVTHMDHSVAWFRRHGECPVPECRCQCDEVQNQQAAKAF